jgi:hypothetical protein
VPFFLGREHIAGIKMNKHIVLLTVMGLLTACASGPLSAKRDLDASGKQEGTVISCSGYKGWSDCKQSAAKMCPSGYDIYSQEENQVSQERTLRINCK